MNSKDDLAVVGVQNSSQKIQLFTELLILMYFTTITTNFKYYLRVDYACTCTCKLLHPLFDFSLIRILLLALAKLNSTFINMVG